VGRPYAIGALGLAYGRVAIAEKGTLRAPGNTGGDTLTPVVEWFFGRGLSIGCNLKWTVSDDWKGYPREEQICLIKQAISEQMSDPTIVTTDITRFLDNLASRTAPPWQHRLHTTNWDYLLQREITRRYPAGSYKPRWLASSHVYHHNGTVERLSNNAHRSPILLETDVEDARVASLESDKAFTSFVRSRVFVVVGMSFECAVDRFLFKALRRVQDEMPVGESHWIVVNPCIQSLQDTLYKLNTALPGATTSGSALRFDSWLNQKMPQLQPFGVLTA
jgi:hypothetical protein